MSSPTDAVILAGPKELLRAAGFRKQGRAFIRELPDLFHVIHFENGKHASSDFGHFNVNILIVIPFAHEAVSGKPFPPNPTRALPSIAKPLWHLIPRLSTFSWGVADSDDTAAASIAITSAIQTWALPFFDGLASLSAVATYLVSALKALEPDGWIYGPALHLAAIRCHQNLRAEASSLLDRLEAASAPLIVELAAATRARLSL